MNNISGGVLGNNTAVPDTIINALPTLDGSLDVRDGFTKKISITGCSDLLHSKGSGNTYCIANGYLALIDLTTYTVTANLKTVTSSNDPVYMINVGDIDYLSNGIWLTAVEGRATRQWGESVTEMQALDWQSTENGSELFLNGTVTQHPGEFVHVPIPMSHLTLGHGRAWGSSGRFVYYSRPESVEWWENQVNFFEFGAPVTMICKVAGGVFIGTDEEMVFLAGTDPAAMELDDNKKYVGVVNHSLTISSSLRELPEKTPTWMGKDGLIYAGTPDGQILDLTKERVKVTPGNTGRASEITMQNIKLLLYRISSHG